ncbi:MAG: response regulator [Pseudomonadota bacterium]
MDTKQFVFSRIAPRLRLVLLAIVLFVLVQPFVFYLSTNRINEDQADLRDQLTSRAFQSALLAKSIDGIATQGNLLEDQSDIAALRASSDGLIAEISNVADRFGTPEESPATLQQLFSDLDEYAALIRAKTDTHAEQIGIASRLTAAVLEARSISVDMLAYLGDEIAKRQLSLNARILELGDAASPENVAETRDAFNDLILLNRISGIVESDQFSVAALDRIIGTQALHSPRGRYQLQMQYLATSIAKLRQSQVQQDIAQRAFALNSVLFGDDGIFAAIASYQRAERTLDGIDSERQRLTAVLLADSERVVQDAQTALDRSNAELADRLRARQFYVIGITVLVSLIAIAALVFVVERQFNRRISLLTNRVLAIARGEPDSGTELRGKDELSAMSDALTVFKGNASELRDVNKTLLARNDDVQQLSARLRTILDTTSSGIVAMDAAGQIILANKPARVFLGGIDGPAPFSRPADVRFLDREDLSPLDASSDPLNRAMAGQVLNNEIALMESPGEGDGRYVRITSNVVDAEDSVVRVVVAIDDVSQAEQNRQQIERASRLDALGQLTGGIAHDFNNLLATIQYAVQLSAGSESQSDRERFSKIAMESVERGSQLSHRLLSFARRQPGVSKSLAVESVIADFKSLIIPTIEEFITVEFTIAEPGMSVFCDGAQLENGLLNLVLNARDAILRSGTGDKILVHARGVADLTPRGEQPEKELDRYPTQSFEAELRAQGAQSGDAVYRYVEFSVSDNGPGMSEEVKRRALDPFFTTKSVNTGTGLGLSMVYGFVQQSGGELRIYSELDRGTTMRLILPRGSLENQREEPIETEMPVLGNGQTILVVEDEAPLLEAMHALLERLGYKVETASSGKAALKMIEAGQQVDLLLTDIVMPGGLGGFALAVKVRALKPDLPILYMSGYAAYSTQEMGGVVAPLIQKPCAPKELAEKLGEALS